MSFGARCLYHVLRGYLRFDNLNNGKDLYRPYRKAAEDLGTKSKTSVQRWYRELEHYGFIVMTTPPCLGPPNAERLDKSAAAAASSGSRP